MRNVSVLIVLLAATSMFVTSCKDDVQVQVALVGDWKMSSECTGDIDRTTGTATIYPGSGEDEIIISNVIGTMVVYYTKVGETPVVKYSSSPTSRDLPVKASGTDITVNYEWTDPNFDPVNDDPEDNRSYTVTGTGSISDDNSRITLNLTVTFPTYDPVVESDGTQPATPKPLSNTCNYTFVKIDDI